MSTVIDREPVGCLFCGAPFIAHEIVAEDGSGRRGHRIDRPDQPQHGLFHWFTVGCKAVHPDGIAWCILPEGHDEWTDPAIAQHLGMDNERYLTVRWSSK